MPPARRKPKLEITLDDLPPGPAEAARPVFSAGYPAPPIVPPAPPPAFPSTAIVQQPVGERTFCRACGTQLDPRAVICTGCGVATGNASPGVAAAALAMNSKSPGVAVLLSLLWTGAGQVYCGRVGRGAAFFCAALVSAVLILVAVGFVLLPIVWIWAAVDAHQLAKTQNRALLAAAGVM